ncbi:MAG: hypothetical protein VX257_03785 [Planctomycetota bacterium]|nr:hypothetical protein [Planctomycetota bacterium]
MAKGGCQVQGLVELDVGDAKTELRSAIRVVTSRAALGGLSRRPVACERSD